MARRNGPMTAPKGAETESPAAQDVAQTPVIAVAEAATAADQLVPASEAPPAAPEAPIVEIAEAAPAVAPAVPAIETFPARYRITNNTPSRAAFPVIKALLEAHGSTIVEVREESHLRQFREDAKRLEALNGWTNAFAAEREE